MKTESAAEHPAGMIVVGDEVFEGKLFGARTTNPVFGEVVFNTSMTGYQEILTDPSYAGQMVVFTAAHIGNTGANSEDLESSKIYAHAAIISNYTFQPSNFRSEESLEDFLRKKNCVGLYGVDTRALTLYLRDRGVTPGVILLESDKNKIAALKTELKSKNFDSIDWILKVTTQTPYWVRAKDHGASARFKVVVYDYGVKQQLVRDLAKRGADCYVVPADYPAEKVIAEKPAGVFLSNGPGDPILATYAIKNIQQLLGKLPIFGVCMGHQLLGLALGAKTYKLKFGHRGGNQPVKNIARNTVEISSHNHGYAVDAKTLPAQTQLTHVNLNDQCCEGLSAPHLKAFSVQYHPESSPGPHDSGYLFDQFMKMM